MFACLCKYFNNIAVLWNISFELAKINWKTSSLSLFSGSIEDRHYGRMVQGFKFKSGFLGSSPSCCHWIGFVAVLQISIPSLWCVNSSMVWPLPQWFLENDMFFNLSFIKVISSSVKSAEVLNMSIPPKGYWPPRLFMLCYYNHFFFNSPWWCLASKAPSLFLINILAL